MPSPTRSAQLRTDLGLDQPFFVQFWHFLVNAAQGEFGLSLRQGAKVSRLIGERFPATLELALVAAVVAVVDRHPHGRVCGACGAARFMSQVFMTLVAAGRVAAHVPDRHPADPGVRRAAGLVSQLRPRRGGAARLVDHRPAHGGRLAPHRAAGHHAGDLPAHADHAAGARRNAGGAAHRLHQVRARARPVRTAPSTSATR